MSTTGDKFPSVGENVTGIGTVAWTNPGNILASDSALATNSILSSEVTNYLRARDFGFAIPSSATIVGVTVKAYCSLTGATSLFSAQLQNDAGALFSIGKNVNVGSASLYTWGGPSDLWLVTFTPAMVNDPDFGVRFWYSGQHNATVDYVTMAIEYIPGVTTMLVDAGEYIYTGDDEDTTTLERFWVSQIVAGAYAYTGGGTTTRTLKLYATVPVGGAYAYTGAAVSFVRAYVMPAAQAAAIPYSGAAATLARARVMPAAEAANIPYTGAAAGLGRAFVMPAAQAAAIPYTGAAATLARVLRIMPAAQAAAIPYTVFAVGLLRPARVVQAAQAAAIPYTVFDAGLIKATITVLPATAGAIPYNGFDVALTKTSLSLPVDVGVYVYSSSQPPATLVKLTPTIVNKTIFPVVGEYPYRGNRVGLQRLPIKITHPGGTPTNWIVAPVPPDFDIEKVTINTVTGGTAVQLVPNDRDHILNTVTGGTTTVDYQLNVPVITNGFRSEYPSVATVDGSGRVRYVAPGVVKIIADTPYSSKGVMCNVNQLVIPTPGYAFVDWVPGSLAYKLAHDYDALIAGTTRAINGQLISQWTPLKRNMNNWAIRAGVDMTPLGMINSTSYAKGQLTLITPRHCITAEHNGVHSGPGHWAQWLAQDGTDRICQRDLVSDIMCQYPPPAAPGLYFDLRVYLLDSDVDSYIGYVKFLPEQSVYSPRLPSIGLSDINESTGVGNLAYWLPVVVQDQRKFANCCEWSGTGYSPGYEYLLQSGFRAPQVGSPRYEYIVAPGPPNYAAGSWSFGDSGSARSLIYNQQLVLQSTISEITYDNLVPTLQNAIDTLGNPDNYQIERVDWSSWPTYPIG